MCVSIIAVSGSFLVCLILDMLFGLNHRYRLPNFGKVENIHQLAECRPKISVTGWFTYLSYPSM